MTLSRRKLAVLLITLSASAGCVTTQGVAQSMYAAEYKCAEDKLTYENVASYSAILVKGCGYEQLYACSPQSGTCVRSGERKPLNGVERAPTTK